MIITVKKYFYLNRAEFPNNKYSIKSGNRIDYVERTMCITKGNVIIHNICSHSNYSLVHNNDTPILVAIPFGFTLTIITPKNN